MSCHFWRAELSPETVQEFQVVNNGLSAESGGGASGPINVITNYFAGEQEGAHGDDGSLISPSVATAINGVLGSGAYPRPLHSPAILSRWSASLVSV